MARNPQAQYSMTYRDYSNEPSSVTIYTRAYNVLTFADDLADYTDLRAAIGGIALGSLVSDQVSPYQTKYNNALPTDENAQRERKWVVRYQDDVDFSIYRVEIPCADVVGRLMPDSDKADLTETDMATFVAQFEETAYSQNGNAVTVLDITAVGRNT